MKTPSTSANYWKITASVGLIGLVILIIAWNAWLAPSTTQVIPRSIEFAIFLIPLAFLTRGILGGTTSVHAYASFTALFYVSFGFWYSFTPKEEVYGYGMLFFGFLLYLGSFMYARATMTREPKEK